MSSLDAAFLDTFADEYRAEISAGNGAHACKTIAERRNRPVHTVQRWAYLARQRGHLAPASRADVRRRSLGVTISPAGHAAISSLAREAGTTVSEMARQLLAEAVNARVKPPA